MRPARSSTWTCCERSCPCAAAAAWPAPGSPAGPPGYEVCVVRDVELPINLPLRRCLLRVLGHVYFMVRGRLA